MSAWIQKVLSIPRRGYRLAVALAAFPEKYRHQNHRIGVLEEQIKVNQRQADIISSRLPVILNYVSSFAHTSRELTRNNDELHRALDENVSRLWERVEFVRSEILYELMYKGGNGSVEKPQLEQKIIDEDKLASMDEEIRVNMGCGHVPMNGYLNLDMRELPGVDIVCGVSDIPLAQNSVSEIYSSHLIEHFPQEELRRKLLPYWYSLLKPGGIFRALLPDWESMISKYAEGTYPFDDLREVTFGAQDYGGDFHFNMFSQDSLRNVLEAAGFRDVSFPVTDRVNGKCQEMEVRAVK